MPIRNPTDTRSRLKKATRPVAWCQPEEPVCPTCGELECLCRPRFFPGQLLAAEDLTRLDHYIKKKNQLHNRYLHGWGVVCGLEVQCHPCENEVTVTSGYALSPCGDDIVVCKPDIVDICKLIKKCRDKEREGYECRPYGATPDCDGAEEEWVLAIRYEEHPSRGMTALRGGGCGCGKPRGQCSCNGGGVVGGCGCGSLKTGIQSKPRGASIECEPTLVCEGYRYEVFRAPQKENGQSPRSPNRRKKNPVLDAICNIDSPLFERICCCWEEIFEVIPLQELQFFSANTQVSTQERFQWCCTLKENLMKYFLRSPGRNCQILEQLKAIVCPDPQLGAGTFNQAFQKSVLGYIQVIIQALIDCWCSAWLPPCPEPSDDPRVPLAVIKIHKKDCKIISVCNWTTLRQFAVTIPMIQYWFSWIHPLFLFQPGRPESEQFCCGGIKIPPGPPDSSVPPGSAPPPQPTPAGSVGGTSRVESPSSISSFPSTEEQLESKAMGMELLKRIRRNPLLSAEQATQSLLTSRKGSIDLSAPGATETADFATLEAFFAPFISSINANLLGGADGPEAQRPTQQATKGEREAVESLRAEVQELNEKLREQDQQLNELSQRIKKGKYR